MLKSPPVRTSLSFTKVSRLNPSIGRSADRRFTGPRPRTDTPRPKSPAVSVLRGFAFNPPGSRSSMRSVTFRVGQRGGQVIVVQSIIPYPNLIRRRHS